MTYNVNSDIAAEFISAEEVEASLKLARTRAEDPVYVRSLIAKAATLVGLKHLEAATLSYVTDQTLLDEMFQVAYEIKQKIYGQRIVMFAPLYLSDYCINGCTYCGYCNSEDIHRSQLTQEELIQEVEILESMGHKRLALECGEDPLNCPIEYVLECIKTIYDSKKDNGEIRRVNVNVAATTVEEYKMLKDAGIGTYILFQETYHLPTYLSLHPYGPKRNYEWHTTAHDRAMQAGIDDVGIGALYGLYDWHYDLTATFLHVEHLEAKFGVGPHTISVPRIRPTEREMPQTFPHAVSDDDFVKMVAIVRMAVPYTGIIISTRESEELRRRVLRVGVSQISAGSSTGVGGYRARQEHRDDVVVQFEIDDSRTPIEITKELMRTGYIPSYCTACYREGRTGDRFMRLAKTGQIGNTCQANALLTLAEYANDYGDEEFKELAAGLTAQHLPKIPNEKVRLKTADYLNRIAAGERDFRW